MAGRLRPLRIRRIRKIRSTSPPRSGRRWLGIFGDRDHIIANELVARFRQLLTDAGKIFEFQIYPGLPHGFAGPGQHYHDKETKDGWHRMLGWFKKHGVA